MFNLYHVGIQVMGVLVPFATHDILFLCRQDIIIIAGCKTADETALKQNTI
jgi:hypothetical protein